MIDWLNGSNPKKIDDDRKMFRLIGQIAGVIVLMVFIFAAGYLML